VFVGTKIADGYGPLKENLHCSLIKSTNFCFLVQTAPNFCWLFNKIASLLFVFQRLFKHLSPGLDTRPTRPTSRESRESRRLEESFLPPNHWEKCSEPKLPHHQGVIFCWDPAELFWYMRSYQYNSIRYSIMYHIIHDIIREVHVTLSCQIL
jgi:hypothetical protein